MSISENVGALSNYFAKCCRPHVFDAASGGKKILKPMPTMWSWRVPLPKK
jgi:deoxyxylulose-5-phosphate synthase